MNVDEKMIPPPSMILENNNNNNNNNNLQPTQLLPSFKPNNYTGKNNKFN